MIWFVIPSIEYYITIINLSFLLLPNFWGYYSKVKEETSIAVDFGGFNEEHAALTGATVLINRIAGIFFREMVDMVTRPIGIFMSFPHMTLYFDPMTTILGVDDEQRKFVVDL